MIPLVGALVVVGVLYFLFTHLSDAARALREMKRAPRVPVAQGKTGDLVRLSGKVRVDGPLIAPLSGKPCAFFHLAVRYARRPQIFLELRDVCDFTLEDETGRARIVASQAVAIAGRLRISGPYGRGLPLARRVALLEQHGQHALVPDAARLSFIEEAFEVGETVTAYGHVDEQVAEGTEAPRLAMRQPLRISDEPSVASSPR